MAVAETHSRSVLIVEDQVILGLELARRVVAAGLAVSGPWRTAEEALSSIKDDVPNAAILDVDLGSGRTSEEVAESLSALNVPFAFLTGYGQSHPVLHKYNGAVHREKPVDSNDVREMLCLMFPERA